MIKADRVRFTLRVPEHLFENVEKESEITGLSKNSIINKILYEYFKNGYRNSKEEYNKIF